ncbi:MAG: hypothetical protein K2H43_05955, partial [Clostridia bacterium]|nr:hypothetical protein [Clostridia bacterium]
MRFGNALRISADNFSAVFKLLLYRLITGILFFSLIYVILKLSLSVVTESVEMRTLQDLVGVFFRSIASGDTERLHGIGDDFRPAAKDFMLLLGRNGGSIAGAIVGGCIMYLLSRFANGLAVFAIGNTINDRMSVFARTSFSSAYFKNIGQATLYQIIYVPIAFVYDALSIAACWLLFFYVPSFLPSLGLFSAIIALFCAATGIVCLEAMKMTVVSAWMPAMIADKKSAGAGLKICLKDRKGFGRRFAGFLVAVYAIIVLNVICALATFG